MNPPEFDFERHQAELQMTLLADSLGVLAAACQSKAMAEIDVAIAEINLTGANSIEAQHAALDEYVVAQSGLTRSIWQTRRAWSAFARLPL